MKIKKSHLSWPKLMSALLAVAMVAGLLPARPFGPSGPLGPLSPFAPIEAEAQMSTSQKTRANFIDVRTGSWHDLALDDEGRIYTWNRGYNNLLGRPTSAFNGASDSNIAVQVTAAHLADGTTIPMPFIIKISSSESSCVVLDAEGRIWTWGNAHGGAGEKVVGRAITSATPIGRPGIVELPGGIRAVDVTAANCGGGAVGEDGKLYVWGNSGNSLTGDGGTALGLSQPGGAATDTAGKPRPALITHDDDGAVIEGVINFNHIFRADYYNNMTSMALGEVVATGEQVIYTWATGASGAGNDAQRGYSARPKKVTLPPGVGAHVGNPIKLIDVGVGWWLFLDSEGDLYTWGSSNSTAGNHMGHGLPAATGYKSEPTKITQVQRYSGTGASYILGPAPKFQSASAYAWTMFALAEDHTVYSNGESNYYKTGDAPAPAVMQYFWEVRPNTMIMGSAYVRLPSALDGKPLEYLYVSAGYTGTSFIDQHGNAYVVTGESGMASRATAAEPWVHVRDDATPLFTSMVSHPDENIKRYDDDKATLNIKTSRATDGVQYVILYPDDAADGFVYNAPGVFGDTKSFYSMSFYEIDPPYFFKGSGESILVSPNGTKLTSRYYANPAITEHMFDQAFAQKVAEGLGNAGQLDPTIPSVPANTEYHINNYFGENCIVWLQTTGNGQTTRIMLPYDNVYTSVTVYAKGELAASGQRIFGPVAVPQYEVARDDAHIVNPSTGRANGYGVPLNRGKNGLAYPAGDLATIPPLGWDVVQPNPEAAVSRGHYWPHYSPLYDVWDYYRLAPPDQLQLNAPPPDEYGVTHRADPTRELVLDDYAYYTRMGIPT